MEPLSYLLPISDQNVIRWHVTVFKSVFAEDNAGALWKIMGGKEHGVKETGFTVSQVLKGEIRPN